MTYYKVLTSNGDACHGGSGKWPLPQGKRLGAWMPKLDSDIIPCEYGYHLCRRKDLIHWLGEAIFEAEARGPMVVHENKIVVSEARLVRCIDVWDKRTARLFAADCAEMVLPIFERSRPNDNRPRKAIETGRAFAAGKIGDAARAAAWEAAREAARYVYVATDITTETAADAAMAAVGYAAAAAAKAAAGAAAGAAATEAVRAAAEDVRRDTAWTAAWNAAMAAMTHRLFQYLAGKEPKTPIRYAKESVW